MDELVVDAGLDPNAVFLVDGQGADPASTTPRQISKWLRWAQTRPWAKQFYAGQPIYGETGSLATYGANSPAAGKLRAKAGTSVAVNPITGRLYSKVQSLSGYMTPDDGRQLVFALYMSGGTFPDLYKGLVDAGGDVAGVAAAFQQGLSK
jgi:D-alanyl-D-alanine carboxypeptidase/D-alanyl-D-alanine-endopeptidase (penicillin-binding protein 4)